MHVLIDLNSLCLYRLQRAQLFIQVGCYFVNFQVTLAVLLFVHSAILLNQLFGDWFWWKFKVFCAVFTAKEKPNLVSPEISIKVTSNLGFLWEKKNKSSQTKTLSCFHCAKSRPIIQEKVSQLTQGFLDYLHRRWLSCGVYRFPQLRFCDLLLGFSIFLNSL